MTRRSLLLLAVLGCGGPQPVAANPAEAVDPQDVDGDHIRVGDDTCPCATEDEDGFEDFDGCPEWDNDLDRIVDACDACPNTPETYNGYEDEDGCTDYAMVGTFETSLVIIDVISFAPDSTALDAAAQTLLDAIAATLTGNPQIVRLELRGHAAAGEANADSLPARRAAEVRAALVARGIAPQRLVAVGAGIGGAGGDPRLDRSVSFVIAETADGAMPQVAPARRPAAAACRPPEPVHACEDGPFERSSR